ncbi:hypothetical protein D3C80_1385460 [compost metagenome]
MRKQFSGKLRNSTSGSPDPQIPPVIFNNRAYMVVSQTVFFRVIRKFFRFLVVLKNSGIQRCNPAHVCFIKKQIKNRLLVQFTLQIDSIIVFPIVNISSVAIGSNPDKSILIFLQTGNGISHNTCFGSVISQNSLAVLLLRRIKSGSGSHPQNSF